MVSNQGWGQNSWLKREMDQLLEEANKRSWDLLEKAFPVSGGIDFEKES